MKDLTAVETVVPFAPALSRSLPLWGDQLLDALPIGVYICDRDGILIRYNARAAQIWGQAPQPGDRRQRHCGAVRAYGPDGQPLPPEQAPMAEVLRTGIPVVDREVLIERPDGTLITVLANIRPLFCAPGELAGAVNCFQDITQRKSSEERQCLLAGEVDHRAKNMLAVIQAVVHLTRADSIPDFKQAIDGRISALSRVHALLSSGRWEGADLRRIVQDELAPYCSGETARVSIEGPSLALSPHLAQSLALVVHELTANAVTYGAIGQSSGQVELRWWRAPGDRLFVRWTESGCAATQAPTRKGFGMSIIEGAIRQQLGGALELEWRADGLRCEIEVPLS